MSSPNSSSGRTSDSHVHNGPEKHPTWNFRAIRPSLTHRETELTDYFVGPRDTEKHSKLPTWMRMHGSITPRMVLPLFIVGCWSTLITCLSQFIYPLVVSNVLLTVLGIVIGLAISFRTSSAYERYADGRKYWALLSQASRDLARLVWIHTAERHKQDSELGKEDLLGKLTALNLIIAFAVSLKHKLRFEPYANYPDLEHLVSHLKVFATEAYDPENHPGRQGKLKAVGNYLAVPFAQSNPRKIIKRSKKNLGNLPLEILLYLSSYINSIADNGTFDNGSILVMAMTNIQQLNEVLAGTERVLNTPLPLAYSIAISQITWVYVMLLPFQLWDSLRWITIPGTIMGAYVILGISAIGREIENPFGQDVNDLPLEHYCRSLAADINVISAHPPPRAKDYIKTTDNHVLYPLSMHEYGAWKSKTLGEIREALRAKAATSVIANEDIEDEDGRIRNAETEKRRTDEEMGAGGTDHYDAATASGVNGSGSIPT